MIDLNLVRQVAVFIATKGNKMFHPPTSTNIEQYILIFRYLRPSFQEKLCASRKITSQHVTFKFFNFPF